MVGKDMGEDERRFQDGQHVVEGGKGWEREERKQEARFAREVRKSFFSQSAPSSIRDSARAAPLRCPPLLSAASSACAS